jgi:hypothetical protein
MMAICVAKNEIPENMMARIGPIQKRVTRAFRIAGGLKMGTLLEIACIQVRALRPDEKARRSTNSETA